MSDLVIDVRQISSYPTIGASNGSETLLLQQGGLGGPYATINAETLVTTALNDGGSMGIGYTLPATNPAAAGQLFASNFIAPIDGGFQFNVFIDATGQLRYWNAGTAADWSWDQSVGFIWRQFTAGSAGAPAVFLPPIMQLTTAGNLLLSNGTLTVARDPANPFDVATLNYVGNNTVHSFNNRNGQVVLNSADVYNALRLCDPLATQPWVQNAINASIQNLLWTCPFVNRWNGRTGSVYLMLSDITTVFYQSGQQPISPTPPITSNDDSIATTKFVTEQITPLLTRPVVIIGATPPANPQPGALWWNSTDGNLYIWYTDPTSSQWVSAMAGGLD